MKTVDLFWGESPHLFLIKVASATVTKLFKRRMINQSSLESGHVPENKLKLLITPRTEIRVREKNNKYAHAAATSETSIS